VSDLEIRPNYIRMKDDAAEVIFSTENANLVCLAKYTGTIVVGSHTPDAGLATFHDINHDIGPQPLGATNIIAWGRVSEATTYIPTSRTFNFSESVILDSIAFKQASYAQVIAALVFVTPVFSGGRVVIRESYFCHANASAPAFTSPNLPDYTIEYDIRPCVWVGGF